MNFARRMQDRDETSAMLADEALLLSVLAPCNPVRRGAGYYLHCPVHADKTPSCEARQLRDGGWRWRCHSCGQWGSVIDLVMKLDGCGFREARRRLGAREVSPAPPPPSSTSRTGEPEPTLLLWCERPGCTNQKPVTPLDVAFMVDRGDVTKDHLWVCLPCRTWYRRHRRFFGLYRLLAPVDLATWRASGSGEAKPTTESGSISNPSPKGWSGPEPTVVGPQTRGAP